MYADKNKTAGVQYTSTVIPAKAGIQFKNDVEGLYQEYLKAFKKGVYNYIKEDQDPVTQETIPRKYFSGGVTTRTRAGGWGHDQGGDEYILRIVHEDAAVIAPEGKELKIVDVEARAPGADFAMALNRKKKMEIQKQSEDKSVYMGNFNLKKYVTRLNERF